MDETLVKNVPEVVLDYEDYLYPHMCVTDGTQSYISKVIVDKGKKYVIVSIRWKDKELEFLLPSGVPISQSGDHETFKHLKREFLKYKDKVFKDAESFGVYEG